MVEEMFASSFKEQWWKTDVESKMAKFVREKIAKNQMDKVNSRMAMMDTVGIWARVAELKRRMAMMDTVKIWARVTARSSFSSGRKDYLIEGSVNSTPVHATADTGAERNAISQSLATSHNLTLSSGTVHEFVIGNGTRIQSPGTVSLPWNFAGESTTHHIDCSIVPGLTDELILSSSFLYDTETLTTHFTKRVKQVARSKRMGLRLLGDGAKRLVGRLNESKVAALPDSGCDLMLVSDDYAIAQGWTVDRCRKNQRPLELCDGTRVFTDGIVRGLDWTFGNSNHTVKCDFYVLKGLPVNVVLSNEFLFHFDAFSQFKDCFVPINSTTGLVGLHLIRTISDIDEELRPHEEQFQEDVESLQDATRNQTPLSEKQFRQIIDRESSRRDLIRDTIARLPENERELADTVEHTRRREWDQARSEYLAMFGSQHPA